MNENEMRTRVNNFRKNILDYTISIIYNEFEELDHEEKKGFILVAAQELLQNFISITFDDLKEVPTAIKDIYINSMIAALNPYFKKLMLELKKIEVKRKKNARK